MHASLLASRNLSGHVLPFVTLADVARRPSCEGPSSGATRHPLIISTHTALLRLDRGSGCFEALSTGAGHYYGVVSSEALGLHPGALLVGSQSALAAPVRNASGLPDGDALLLIATTPPKLLGAWVMPTAYLHDSTVDDTGTLHATDTASGQVLELRAIPPAAGGNMWSSLVVRRQARVATQPGEARVEHVNGVSFDERRLWVMHHRMNLTSEVRVYSRDDAQRGECARLPLGGTTCHGVLWYGGRLLYLLSAAGGIAALSPGNRSAMLWSAGDGYFSKGLAVLDGVAYFGLAAKQLRFNRNEASCEIVALDLESTRVLWRRAVPFPGLVNAISLPSVGSTCSWRACSAEAARMSRAAEEHGPQPGQWDVSC